MTKTGLLVITVYSFDKTSYIEASEHLVILYRVSEALCSLGFEQAPSVDTQISPKYQLQPQPG